MKMSYSLAESEQELQNLYRIAKGIFGKPDGKKSDNVQVIDTIEGAMEFMSKLRNG